MPPLIVIPSQYDRQFFFVFFGRTDLKIGASKAKFDAEPDFEVHLAVAPPKSIENDEKLISKTGENSDFFFRFFLRFLVPPEVVQG